MGFKEDITHIFSEVLRQHGGNKAAAAESLGVNTVTFWGWVEGKRTPNTEALAPLLDKENPQRKCKISLSPAPPPRGFFLRPQFARPPAGFFGPGIFLTF